MVFAIKPVYRVEIVQEFHAAALVLNTPHFEWSGGGGLTYPTAGDLLALGNAWKEAFRPQQANHLVYIGYKGVQVAGDGVTYDPTNCRQVGGAVIEVAASGTVIGSDGAASGPSTNALVVSFRTGLAGKSRHGRQYLTGYNALNAGDGVWASALVTSVQTAVNTFLGVYGAGGTSPDWTMVVFSRVIASGCKADPNTRHHPLVHLVAGDQANASKHVTDAVIDSVVRSQRTRQIGKGA